MSQVKPRIVVKKIAEIHLAIPVFNAPLKISHAPMKLLRHSWLLMSGLLKSILETF